MFIALAIATTGLFEAYPRFEAIGPELLRNGGLQDGLDGWSKQEEGGAVDVTSETVRIKNVDSSRTVGIRQTVSVLPNHQFLMLSRLRNGKRRAGGRTMAYGSDPTGGTFRRRQTPVADPSRACP